MLTFLSDFGTADGYPGAMKAVAGGITDRRLVDITHDIPKQDVWKAAYVYLTTAGFYPSGTVHVGVVDPGVGTERRGLVVEAGGQFFVGPDNGIFIPAARELGDMRVFVIENRDLFVEPVSSTFHGRDVFSPVGAWLASGVGLGEVGPETDDYVELGFDEWSREDGFLRGMVINVDRFGNVITNIPGSEVSELDFGERVFVEGIEMPFQSSYGQVEVGSLLLTVGSHGYLEVGVNQGSASESLGIGRRGQVVVEL
ncbi:S-adenosyl-l-methionine hydroxide adenosyltransferase family protein [Methanonatronarchaeum sp. AMET6-2]|uniref:SAM hydrolase/SAM-dependent halogenase family protein n=1 Tax=Methanonatronarchaeum sp. AMET6-2 TaxID=2933293 RepID=UPI002111B89B|nr:S-adenosyl-l-methionine hydroxide adenosyltransferase family protein [Methanonatronarchaeum sp. AMET6-2]